MALYIFRVKEWSNGEEEVTAIEADSLKEAMSEYESEWYGGLLNEDWYIEKITIERITSFSKKVSRDND